jgi:hypothetical protein
MEKPLVSKLSKADKVSYAGTTRRKGSRYSLVLEELQGLRLDSDSEINKWQPVRKTVEVRGPY